MKDGKHINPESFLEDENIEYKRGDYGNSFTLSSCSGGSSGSCNSSGGFSGSSRSCGGNTPSRNRSRKELEEQLELKEELDEALEGTCSNTGTGDTEDADDKKGEEDNNDGINKDTTAWELKDSYDELYEVREERDELIEKYENIDYPEEKEAIKEELEEILDKTPIEEIDDDDEIWDYISDFNEIWGGISQAVTQAGGAMDAQTASTLFAMPEAKSSIVGGVLLFKGIDFVSNAISGIENREDIGDFISGDDNIDSEEIGKQLETHKDNILDLKDMTEEAGLREEYEEIKNISEELLDYQENNNLSDEELAREKNELAEELTSKNKELSYEVAHAVKEKYEQALEEGQEIRDEKNLTVDEFEEQEEELANKIDYYYDLVRDTTMDRELK